ncbi:pyridoxamine 5'-phosphate oxidase family protein [Winogradskyella sp.]|jgi:nitroimidazol reductase NimA-like FMN-containing flavoprotein (pyridoxamine 5'-phosphate oxidase superfamily)|uniref:pyridoxamine 5'-phosphate oxidase family protein n=1 Tax=Winogradskyella sp. TaxID=1883156 RepID=UPI0025E4B0A9|nr:pyridoxamine 5'-phosphate oxidase family protein [Winogradskyella sp.]MCT4630412.1 pyridoxamine 5'-phosphate oxidase family protein [Winogradskyella sp.]
MIKSIDYKTCSEIFNNNYVGYLSYISNNKPYVIPITYFYNEKDKYIVCYSGNGHKINAMRKHNSVSLNVSDIYNNNKWQSASAHGQYKEIDKSNAKLYLHEFSLGIKNIVLRKERKDLDFISEFSSKIFDMEIPVVFLIKIDNMTGKMKS